MPFVTIPNTVFEAGKPIRAIDMRSLRDNLLAVVEGDTTAPKINQGAIDRLNPGNLIRVRDDSVAQSGLDSTLIKSKTFDIMQVGTVRLTYEHSATGSSAGLTEVRRSRAGGSTTLTSFANTNSYVSRTLDIDVLPGDEIAFWISGIAGGAPNRGLLRFARLRTAGENFWVGQAETRLEGNVYA